MKKTVVLSLALLAVLALAPFVATPVQAGDVVTKTGEVIDSACYIQKGAKGEGHKECTKKCADAGIPLALLEDGTNQVIWLTGADHGSANDVLKPYAAQKVTITGELSERGGTKLMVVEKVEPAS